MIKKSLPKVSVIVPAYNCEATIVRCVGSILAQTYPKIEVLIVDDCSIDGTNNALKRYHGRVSILKTTKHSGVSAARNLGLLRASGEIISFVDADDYIDCKMIEKMVDAMGENVDLVCCGRKNISARGEKAYLRNAEDADPRVLSATTAYCWDKLYRKAVIEKNKLRFDEELSYAEDFDFISRYKLFAREMRIVAEPLYFYDVSNDNSITRANDKRILDIPRSISSVIDFYRKHDAFSQCRPELLKICVDFYRRRVSEFRRYANARLKIQYIKRMLRLMRRNFPKDYRVAVCTWNNKRKYNVLFSSIPLMCIMAILTDIASSGVQG